MTDHDAMPFARGDRLRLNAFGKTCYPYVPYWPAIVTVIKAYPGSVIVQWPKGSQPSSVSWQVFERVDETPPAAPEPDAELCPLWR